MAERTCRFAVVFLLLAVDFYGSLSLSLHRTGFGDFDLLTGLAHVGSIRFNLAHNIHPVGHLSKDSVLAVEPWRFSGTNKEL